MCYDVSYLTRKAKKYAEHYGTTKDWEDIKKRLPSMFHVSGFDEPTLPGITAEHEGVVPLDWPFIPPAFAPISSDNRPLNTLNARDDKIFTKKSIYFEAANARRCAVVLDGIFDHHHKNGHPFPHFVKLKNDYPMFVAGIWQVYASDEIERECVSLVTTRANKEMAWIHNEPAYSLDSRMILILPDMKALETWIHGSVEEAQEIIKPLPDGELEYYPCRPLRSNKKLNRIYLGNIPEIQERTYYPELEEQQGSLF